MPAPLAQWLPAQPFSGAYPITDDYPSIKTGLFSLFMLAAG
jgi:hypothetical protein